MVKESDASRFDVSSFLSDIGIHPAGVSDRHYVRGWVNISCPFCTGHPGNHLGWNKRIGWTCFRCGYHPLKEVVSTLLGNPPEREVRQRIREYLRPRRETQDFLPPRKHEGEKEVPLPEGSGPMGPRHFKYLEGRGFQDPEKIAFIWGLQGSGPMGPFKHRIIAPVIYEGRRVSYQGRDITGKANLRYKNCPTNIETRPLKECLYGMEKNREETGIVVEGIVDVWKMGPGSMATFGIAWTIPQAILLSQYKRIVLFFDPEEAAQKKAEKLGFLLAQRGIEVSIATKEGMDPGDMSEREAQYLLTHLQK